MTTTGSTSYRVEVAIEFIEGRWRVWVQPISQRFAWAADFAEEADARGWITARYGVRPLLLMATPDVFTG